MTIKDQFTQYIHTLQNTICAAIVSLDGKARFVSAGKIHIGFDVFSTH